jgi:hypothetical protein
MSFPNATAVSKRSSSSPSRCKLARSVLCSGRTEPARPRPADAGRSVHTGRRRRLDRRDAGEPRSSGSAAGRGPDRRTRLRAPSDRHRQPNCCGRRLVRRGPRPASPRRWIWPAWARRSTVRSSLDLPTANATGPTKAIAYLRETLAGENLGSQQSFATAPPWRFRSTPMTVVVTQILVLQCASDVAALHQDTGARVVTGDFGMQLRAGQAGRLVGGACLRSIATSARPLRRPPSPVCSNRTAHSVTQRRGLEPGSPTARCGFRAGRTRAALTPPGDLDNYAAGAPAPPRRSSRAGRLGAR